MPTETSKLYENAAFQTAAEDILRPGGLHLTKKAMEIADFAKGSRILDIGCGCGITVEYLQETCGLQAMGIDISKKLVAKAKMRNSTLNVTVGDVCQLPYGDRSFDGVVCECVFSLFENKPQSLSQINRVLNPGGKLIISDLYLREKNGELSDLPFVTCINGIISRDLLIEEVTTAGFQLIDWQDETSAYIAFIAGLIMKYGSLSLFWENLLGSCEKARDLKNNLKDIKIGYYLSVWEKVI